LFSKDSTFQKKSHEKTKKNLILSAI